MCSVELVVLLS